MIRDRLAADLKDAIRSRDSHRAATLRLMLAAIKDRDIAARSDESLDGATDRDVCKILSKMVRQREDSARIFEEEGRIGLAEQERREIKIIRNFLPRPLTDTEMQRAIADAILDTDARSIRDMGRVMAHLKERYTGRMDFCRAGTEVKTAFRCT